MVWPLAVDISLWGVLSTSMSLPGTGVWPPLWMRVADCTKFSQHRRDAKGEKDMAFEFGPRRGIYIDISQEMKEKPAPLSKEEVEHFETFDLIYRSLCAVMYN